MTDNLDYRILTFDQPTQRDFTRFVRQTFAPEDEVLLQVRANAQAHGLPAIDIRPEEGQVLQFMAMVIGARRILEIGTLAGYSAIWLARALPADGQLITLEYDPRHAQIARENFALAGLSDRVDVREGVALDTLAQMDADPTPFDLVFLDADKANNPAYLTWAIEHVRPGGLITSHNVFREGHLLDQHIDASARGMLDMLDMMTTDPRLISTIFWVGDGFATAMVRA